MDRVETALLAEAGLGDGIRADAGVDAQQSAPAQYRRHRVHARGGVLVDGQFRLRRERLLGAAFELADGAVFVAGRGAVAGGQTGDVDFRRCFFPRQPVFGSRGGASVDRRVDRGCGARVDDPRLDVGSHDAGPAGCRVDGVSAWASGVAGLADEPSSSARLRRDLGLSLLGQGGGTAGRRGGERAARALLAAWPSGESAGGLATA